MEKNDEIRNIIQGMNPINCNLIMYMDKNLLSELITEIFNKCSECSDCDKKYYPIILSAKDLQDYSVNLDERIVKFKQKSNMLVTDEDYKLIELRKSALNSNDLDELRDIKQQVFDIERQNKSDTSEKRLILSDYMLLTLVNNILNECDKIKIAINDKEKTNIKEKLDLLNSEIDFNKIFLVETIVYDEYSFYELLKNKKEYVVTFIKDFEYVVDYDLQEIINNYMFNKRNDTFSMIIISLDTMYHRNCGKYELEETHDVITTLVKSKRYYEVINK